MSMKRAQIIKEVDNVATALENIDAGSEVKADVGDKFIVIKAKEKIQFGFKIALKDISKGNPIIKYGEIIGKASSEINAGSLVHVHNVDGIYA